MNSERWLKENTDILAEANIGTARLDVLVLLEDTLGKDRGWLLAHQEFELDTRTTKKLAKLIARRASHEPLAYIRGKTEFYGREFIINKNVLEPRPESETMIDLLKTAVQKDFSIENNPQIIDIGTGSGALAITAKLEIDKLGFATKVTAIDIDEKCLKVASKNSEKYKTKISFLRSDLVKNTPEKQLADTILLCNLPYVPDSFIINPSAMREPKLAIYGGLDGLDVYRQLFNQIDNLKAKPKTIFAESLPPQHEKLEQIATQYNYKLVTDNDFIQQFDRITG